MSRSAPYNIIVSRSAEAIEKLFFDEAKVGRTSIRDRRLTIQNIKNLGTDSTGRELAEDLIITPFNNKEFISFETSLPGGGNVKFATLKLAETDRILEKFVIPPDGVSNMIASQFREKAKVLGRLTSDLLEQMKLVRPRYYISFGVGDNISRWAGPFIVDLIDANISITSDGVRQLELGFTPTVESIKIFTNKVFKDGDSKISIFDNLRATSNFLRVSSEDIFPVEKVDPPDFPQKLESLNSKDDRWNYALRQLIQKYISDRFPSIPRDNILVLFPQDLDGIEDLKIKPAGDIQSRFRDIVSLYRSKLAQYGVGIFSLYDDIKEGDEVLDPTKTEITENILIDAERTRAARVARDATDPNIPPGDRPTSNDVIVAQKRANENIEKIRSEAKVARSSRAEQRRTAPVGGGVRRVFSREADLFSTLRREKKTAEAEGTNTDEIFETDEYKNIEYITLSMLNDVKLNDIDDQVAEVLRPLYTFFRHLREVTDQAMDLTIFEENDLKTTRLLSKYGLIEDSTAPVVVLGETSLVTQLLYEEGRDLPEGLGSTFSVAAEVEEYENKWKSFKEDLTRDIQDVRGRSEGITSSYNEQIDFGPYNGFQQQIGYGTFVFMHNLKNSNVLDISVDSSPYRGELINLASESKYKLIDAAIDGNQEIFNNTFSFSAVDKFIETQKVTLGASSTPQQIFDALRNDRMFLEALVTDPSVSSIKVVDFLDLVRFKFLASKNNTSVMQEVLGGRVAQSTADIVRKMNKYVFQVQIRTLPFFNTNYYLNKRALLVGIPNKIIGSRFLREDLPPPSIFSNTYKVFGYRHVLTPTEAYSEFELFQDGITPSTNFDLTLGDYFKNELESIREEIQ